MNSPQFPIYQQKQPKLKLINNLSIIIYVNKSDKVQVFFEMKFKTKRLVPKQTIKCIFAVYDLY